MKNNIPDFAVSSQEAGFDKFLKVYNEYFKFDFFGNANFYGAKNGEDYQTGQAWITPITPSEAIALLTNQTDKMNTLENSCFQFQENDEASKKCIRIMNERYKSASPSLSDNFRGYDEHYYSLIDGMKNSDKNDHSRNGTVIPASDYLALLTNQTTDKMNTLENSCFKYDGSDDSKNIIRIMNKNHRSDFKGNDKYFYWIANDIADTFYKMDKDLTEIPPYEYLALLTGKQLTEGDLIVGNRFECIEDSFLKHFTKGLIYPCEKDGTLESNSIRWSEFDSAFLNRHFKLLPTQKSVKEIDCTDSHLQVAHLQQQLKEAKEKITELEKQLSNSMPPFC